MPDTDARHVALDACFNVRDLGGYPTGDGRTVRWGQVFRGDGVHRLTADQARPLHDLGIRTVLDLRTGGERDEVGAFTAEDIDVLHLPVLQKIWDRNSLSETDDPVDFLIARYLEMLDEGADALATAVEIIASAPRRPLLFHCAAGKDRTGVLASLLLEVIGVDDDVIAADYHLSAEGMQRMVEWFRVHRPEVYDSMSTGQGSRLLYCPPDAMRGFLGELRRRHGSAAGYLQELGVSSATLAGLRDDLTE